MTLTNLDFLQDIKEKQTLYKYLINEAETKQSDYNTLLHETNELVAVSDALKNILVAVKLILEKITFENKARLELFATNAMQQIFTDKDYSIELEIKEDTKRPAINILLVENGIKQDIKDSVGGGIITTLGLLFQIYYLEVYELNKIIFIDEGLKEVSKTNLNETTVDYLTNLLNFLKALSQERNYKVVVVTHDESVKQIANQVYVVRDGEVNKIKE